jgi:hypothetical protein
MNSERPTNGIDTPDDDTELRALLAPFADVLGSEATWAEPPAGLVDSIVDQLRSTDAEVVALAPPVSIARRRRRPAWAMPAMAAAAAVMVFLAGFLIADRQDDDDVSAIADIELTGTALAPEARARGDVRDRGAGYAIRLDMAGLPPAAEGEFYEGWLRADDGEMVSVGTFHMRSGDSDVVLWSGVRIAEYHTLIVTEEQERSGAEASDRVMLEGAVERRG